MDSSPELLTYPGEEISILVVAGEASGDLHAACLCEEIQQQLKGHVRFWGSGGDRLARMGARLLASSQQLAAIGPVAAVSHLRQYYRLYRSILREVQIRPPRMAILVDFPDFNLRLARALKKKGKTPIVYFISPQIWAWRAGRVNHIRQAVDKMIVLFPFEVDFYRAHGVQVDYFGHPLACRKPLLPDRESFVRRHGLDSAGVLVAVLPGSRQREIQAILPVVLHAAAKLNAAERGKLQLVVASAAGLREEIENVVSQFSRSSSRDRADRLENHPRRPVSDAVKVKIADGSEEVLAHCDYAFVKSGTSTLEAALAGIPFCVIYRVSPLSWMIGKLLVSTDHYALPNLILKKRVVPELMQGAASPRRVAEVLSSFIRSDPKWESVRQGLGQVKEKLVAENPYREAARAAVQLLGCDP